MSRHAPFKLLTAPLLLLASFCLATPAGAGTPAASAAFGLLSAHGAHHVAQINEVAANDFRGEARAWEAMRKHMLVIADSITDALAKQFPDRFQHRAT